MTTHYQPANSRPAGAQPTESREAAAAAGQQAAAAGQQAAAAGQQAADGFAVGGLDPDRYTTAAGLIERSAAAYASGVPEDPADDGYFGPGSMTWRASADLSGPLAGLRALMLQALHPLAMAGVDQHSRWREDPVGRLAATSGYLSTVMFGDKRAAERAAAAVRRVHKHVEGVDEITGRRYAASDPELLLWVHAALVDSDLAVRRMFGTELSAADADRYVAEMAAIGELIGIPRPMIPADAAGLERYLESVRPQLRLTPAAAEAAAYLLDPPGLDPDVAEIWQDVRYGALAALPEWARRMYGYELPEPLTPQRRTEVRQALGLLDAVFIGEPGVLEARQRIAARVRAARRG